MKTTQEMNRRRTENLRKERKLRLEEKRSGRTDERRLAFLRDMMDEMGITNDELAHKCGMKKQLLYYYLNVKDNCKISIAEELCKGLGYKLGYVITSRGTRNQSFINPADSAMPECLKECAADPFKRMHPLAEFLFKREHSIVTLNKMTGIDRALFYRVFGRDDMAIDDLDRTVRAYGKHITWTLKPIKEEGGLTIKKTTERCRKEADKKNDHNDENHTGFIVEEIESSGKSWEDVEEAAGMNADSILYELKDVCDCKISRAETYLSVIGKRPVPVIDGMIKVKKSKRISAVLDLIEQNGDTPASTARKCGIPASTLRYDIATDDMKLSRFRKIMDTYGKNLEWKAEKNK